MKKKLLIVAAICASLFVVAPAVSVSAAEVESEVQVQSEQSDIGIAPCADEIVTKFRLIDGQKNYSIVVGTRPEDTGWIRSGLI
mgnify:CR=1 FL=1